MKVLVAGASGAIGQFLVPQLVAAGHEVVGTTRRQDKADALTALGARGVIVDALDREAVRRLVLDEAPEAIIDELTSLPRDYNLRDPHLYDANDEIRSKGTPALHDAAREAGVRRYVMQSIAFLYAPEGDWVKDEDAAMWFDAPGRSRAASRVLHDNEQRITGDRRRRGGRAALRVVLRTGHVPRAGRLDRGAGAQAPAADRRQRRRHELLHPRARRRGGDGRRAGPRQRHLQRGRRRSGARTRLDAGLRARRRALGAQACRAASRRWIGSASARRAPRPSRGRWPTVRCPRRVATRKAG